MGLAESQTRRIQVRTGIALGIVCWALGSVAYLLGLFQPFDLSLLDLRFRLRGERPTGDRIALVGVDDATIRGYGAWPLPRESYALLIQALEEAGARAIGVDLQFPNDGNQDPASNQILAHVSAAHENVAHAIWFFAQAPRSTSTMNATALEALDHHGIATAAQPSIAVAAGAALPFEELATSARRFGHITVVVDRDGAIRRIPLFVRFGQRTYPALSMVVYGIEQGWAGVPTFQRVVGGLRLHWPSGAQLRIPVGADGSTSIDFAGDAESFPLSYSMLQVLQWYQAGDSARLRETFGGRAILVGLTSHQEASEDVGPTPFAAATPLLFVHANVLDNLHRGRFLNRVSDVAYVSLLGVLSVALGLACATLALPVSAAVVALALVLVASISQGALSWASLDLPPFLGLVLPPALYSVAASHRFLFLERRAKKREDEIREGLTVQQQFLPEALIGKRLSSYLIEDKLGSGGMGTVYRARDERSGREVALKVLSGGYLADEKARRRFRHEALALSRLRHPYIAGWIDSDSQDGFEFIVMEFIRGESLAGRIRRRALSAEEAVPIGSQVCEALAEAHARGILHRDLKPPNVMLDELGDVKLLDFGVARLTNVGATMATVTGSMTESGHIVGTLPYLAPEVVRGEPADERTDLYGVGMLLFEMLTGVRPFREERPHELIYMILNQPPPVPSVLNGRIGADLERLILALLSKDPGGRPASADETLRRLREVAPWR